MRRILLGVAVVAGVGAVVLAVLPFSFVLEEADLNVKIQCKPPVVSAWSHGKKQLALWATTFEDGSSGATVRSGEGPFCGEKARPRLAIAGLLGGIAVVSALASRRSTASG
jgi:hypothetical protein